MGTIRFLHVRKTNQLLPDHKLNPARAAGTSTLGWWLGLASVANFIAAMIAGIAVLNHPDYVIKNWHIWILFVVVTWMAIGMNVFFTRWLPMWNKFIRTIQLFFLNTDFVDTDCL